MSLTVQQLLSDAKRLTSRLRDHDGAADTIITAAQDVLKEVEAMRQYQEDIESLNTIAHNRPRAQLVLGIQQENRHIRQLQHENKELRAALEEHQNVLELIMSKYRQHMSCLVHSTKIEKDLLIQENSKVLQDRADKICEMANVMQKSIQIDEDSVAKEQELMSRLITENKGLREMLEISNRNGSYTNPLVGPRLVSTSSQTTEDLYVLSSEPPNLLQHSNLTIMAVKNSSNDNPCNAKSPSGSTCSSTAGSNNCTSPTPPPRASSAASSSSGSSLVMNGAIQEDAISDPQRPLSSASEESESSISEDDEISFNTIRRQVKPALVPPPQPQPEPASLTLCDENTSSSAVNNSKQFADMPASDGDNSDAAVVVMQINGSANVAATADDKAPAEDGNNNGNNHSSSDNDMLDDDEVTEVNAVETSSNTIVLKKINAAAASEAMIESSASS